MKSGRHPKSDWTVDRVERLAQMWWNGMTGTEISAELGGVSRCAVLGKVDRMMLKRSGKAGAVPPPEPKSKPEPVRARHGTTCDVPDCRNTAQRGYREHKCAEHLPRRPRTVGSRPLVDTGAAM